MVEPLSQRRVVVTRSREQAPELAQKLVALGAIPLIAPAIRFVPLPNEELDRALADLAGYDWLVFTSANAVAFFFRRVQELGVAVRGPRIAASGTATAARLAELGVSPDFVPAEFIGEALVAGLALQAGMKVLLPRARRGRPEIAALMREQGAAVDDIALYDTLPAVWDDTVRLELEKGFDAISFTSPSSVRNFLGLSEDSPAIRRHLQRAVIACIGPITVRAAEDAGLSVAVVPSRYTTDDLCQALADYFSRSM
ncbi:MAG: uroporphyrinogen-III synthase [Caldilineae bacterium]|nr:MAG: uroporphyrinogen-III synthase [Caldilineae bacterium]